MKKILLSLVVLSMVAVGCAKNKSASANSGVTDLSPAAQPAYTPPPSVAAQPVVSETPVSLAAASTPADTSTVSSVGSTYKVKKGDTLFSIAKAKYGDGKQWHKIANANPGVTPQSLKVGQTLNVP